LSEQDITVTAQDGGILVQGEGVTEVAWTAQRLDEKRILVVAEDGRIGLPQPPAGLASCRADVFRDFLLSLHQAGWSGQVAIDTGYGLKRVYFSRGDIVFAASTIMDDRLGEVIYREARITLDDMTNSAAQVTKSRKFGQVLLSSGIFTNVELWDALKMQVRQILRSLFMVERIYFELQEGAGLAPTEVVFAESMTDLVCECYGFGAAFRVFLGKLRAESEVELLVPREQLQADYEAGTFVGDLLALIDAQPNVQELLNTSKLIDSYTVSALLNLVNRGLCRVRPDIEPERKVAPQAAPQMAALKAKIDAHAYVLQAVRKAFADASTEFPIMDVSLFVEGLNPIGFPSLFVDANGALNKDCVSGLISQCAQNVARIPYFIVRIESIIQFLLQVAGDNLEFAVAKKIRQDYRAVSS
jgi:hypothetical protein